MCLLPCTSNNLGTVASVLAVNVSGVTVQNQGNEFCLDLTSMTIAHWNVRLTIPRIIKIAWLHMLK